MAKKPIKPLIKALAEHIADDVIASHEAGFSKRKRLPKEYWKKELAKEDPRMKKGSKDGSQGQQGKRRSRGS